MKCLMLRVAPLSMRMRRCLPPFVKCLVRLTRAKGSYGSWEGKSEAELLGDLIVTRKQRPAIPVIGDLNPDVLWRLDMFYTAVGLAIEERCGLMAPPIMEMKPMRASGACLSGPGGWSFCRDLHRFSIESLRKLAEAVRNWSTMRPQPLKPIPTWRRRDETNFRGRINVRP